MSTVAEAQPAPRPSAWGRFRGWLANPWGRPRFLVLFTWAYMIWSIVSVLIAVQFSFNDSRRNFVWKGFTLEYWWRMRRPDWSAFRMASR